jgi:hypothetical protein
MGWYRSAVENGATLTRAHPAPPRNAVLATSRLSATPPLGPSVGWNIPLCVHRHSSRPVLRPIVAWDADRIAPAVAVRSEGPFVAPQVAARSVGAVLIP